MNDDEEVEHDSAEEYDADEESAVGAFLSDEEREAIAAAGAAMVAPPDDGSDDGVKTWADVANASPKPQPRSRRTAARTVTIGGVERVLSEGETTSRAMIDCPISQPRRIEMVQEMVLLLDQKRAQEAALKEHVKIVKGEIADVDRRARDLGLAASSGVEARPIDVVTLRDDRRGDMTVVRCDTGAELKRWPQTFVERQGALPGVMDVMAAPAEVAVAPPPKKRRARKPSTNDARAS